MTEKENDKPSRFQRLRKNLDSFGDALAGIDAGGLVFFLAVFVIVFLPAIIGLWLARRRWGWLVLIVIAVAAGAALYRYYPDLLNIKPGIYVLLSLVCCFLFSIWFGIAVGAEMFGMHLELPAHEWDDLTPLRKAGRLLLTFAGTALFLSPFVFVAWYLIKG